MIYNPMSQYQETIKTYIGHKFSEKISSDVSLTTEISTKFMGIGSKMSYSVKFG